jgi:Flp pilus assembly protein TadD
MRRSFRPACLALLLLASLGLPHARADGVSDAQALLGKGQAEQALQRVDALIKQDPKDIRARFLRGVILSEQQKPNEAIAVFRAVSDERPELPEPYNNLGVLYASMGRYDDARRALESAILADPKYAVAHENLGDVYARMAARSYEQAGKLDPKSGTAREKLKLIDQLFIKK